MLDANISVQDLSGQFEASVVLDNGHCISKVFDSEAEADNWIKEQKDL